MVNVIYGFRVCFLSFLRSCVKALSERGSLLAFFNIVFFCSFFVVVLVAQFLFPPPLYSSEPPIISWVPFPVGDWFMLFVWVFVFNLVVSAFAVVTLSGIVFFPFSAGFLTYRAVLWGLLFYSLPSSVFLAVLPTLILESEAYVVAAVAGTVVGLSWVKPSLAFKYKELSRLGSFMMALKEAGHLYKAVVLLLLAAATVETITIFSLT
jgi:hypothetical protein